MAIISLNSNKSVIETEEEIEIIINSAETKLLAFTAYIDFDSTKLEYIYGPENTNIIDNRLIYVWYDETGGDNPLEGELAKFVFKSKENGTVKLSLSGDFFGEKQQLIDTEFTDLQIQIGDKETGTNLQSEISTLQSLRLGVEGIIPEFNSDIQEYYITISNDINEIEVITVTENPNAQVEITGNTNLQEGLNTIEIKVISADNSQNTVYKIYVTKTDNKDLANTNLETLAIENILLNPPFDTNITNYNVEVSNETSDINVLAIAESEKANVQVIGSENIVNGENKVVVSVTAENGYTEREYNINVYKRNDTEEAEYIEEQENKVKNDAELLQQVYYTEESEIQTEETENVIEDTTEKKLNFPLILFFIFIIFTTIVIYKIKRK